ncbi:unnamed protein product [Caenorhabditis bovis]|uniref:F-box associated domain-containing protein n=1 Tax=Caenorhabditis bovis TaxID=2654633 RepID=A0A8S1F6L2_9PELO|nr:unnamed protein product [Caenorhabditis bovis]
MNFEFDFTAAHHACSANEHDPHITKNMMELVRFIGRFPQWSRLPKLAQINVVNFLDYESRLQLAICSRSTYSVVKMSPISIRLLEIHCAPGENGKMGEAFVRAKFSKHRARAPKGFIATFVEKRDGETEMKFDGDRVELRTVNYADEAVKVFERMAKLAGLRVDLLEIDMPESLLTNCSILKRLDVKQLRLKNREDKEHLRKTLDLFGLDNKGIRIRGGIEHLTPQLLFHPQIQNADSIEIEDQCKFTDEAFLGLNGRNIMISTNGVSDSCLNKFIKRWMVGGGPNDFESLTLHPHRLMVKDKILANIPNTAENFTETYSVKQLHGQRTAVIHISDYLFLININ